MGYFIIKYYELVDLVYILDYFNQEVWYFFQEVFLKEYFDYLFENLVLKVLWLWEVMCFGDLEEVFQIINVVFVEIFYDYWKG